MTHPAILRAGMGAPERCALCAADKYERDRECRRCGLGCENCLTRCDDCNSLFCPGCLLQGDTVCSNCAALRMVSGLLMEGFNQ